VSWMVLPWHANTLRGFANEQAVAVTIRTGAPAGGVYLLPSGGGKAAAQQMREGPVVLAAVRPDGVDPVDPRPYLRGLLIEMLAALLITALLRHTQPLPFWKAVRFVLLVALTGGVLCRLPDWNWWGFSADYTLVSLMDLAIGWGLGGLVIAHVCTRDT